MDSLQSVFLKIAAPFFFPFFPNQRIYVVYIASALALAFAVYLVGRASRRGSMLRGFLGYCFPKAVYAHKSAIVDYKYFFINKMSFGILFAPLIVGSSLVSASTVDALDFAWGPPDAAVSAGIAATVAFTGLVVLAFDAGIFGAHYLQHKVPFLWEFHKIHHSASVLTPITVYRMHPVDDLLSGTFIGVLTGAVHGVFAFLYGDGVGAVTILEINVILFAYYVAGYNLRHSHVWLAYPKALSHIFVSPAQHQIHHSKEARHFDRNIGFIFAFWDWMAGTLYVPETHERFDFGLYNDEHLEFDSVWKLYSLPFRKLIARFRAPEGIAQ